MRKQLLALLCLVATFATTACAQNPPPPTGQALPPGHPPIGGQPPATQSAPLPKGHPDIAQMTPGGLPKGHPDISKMRRPGQAPKLIGSITVRAIQGSAGAPPVGPDQVYVELLGQGAVIDKTQGKLDASGTLKLSDIPVAMPVQPVVTIIHGGVEHRAVGQEMTSANPDQEIEIPVYEPTDQEPQWSIRMRHLILHRHNDGLRVTEMLVVHNPTDRAWVGRPLDEKRRTTLVLPLPAGAQKVALENGFHECCTQIADGRLTNTMALMPGMTHFQLSYTVPARDGKAQLTVAAPAPVKQFMVFVPDDGSTVVTEGLEAAGTSKTEKGSTRFYRATTQPAGAVASIALSGIKSAAPAGGADISTTAQIIGGAGAVIILLVAAALFLFKAPKSAGKHP